MSNWQQTPSGFDPASFSRDAVPPYAPQPPKSSSTWLWILLALGGVLFLSCGACVVGVAMFGMNIVAEEVAGQVRDNPKFREHIGELESLNVDWVATSANDDDETFVYKAKGNKGSGVLTVKQETDDDGNEVIREASLRLKSGTTVQIVP